MPGHGQGALVGATPLPGVGRSVYFLASESGVCQGVPTLLWDVELVRPLVGSGIVPTSPGLQ